MLIEADQLSKAYRGRGVVTDVTFAAHPGTLTVLAGPNGAGKSTVFSLMTDIVSGGGLTTYDGVAWRSLDSPRRVVGAYLGASPFHSGVRVGDHLRLLAAVGGVGRKQVESLLEQFQLGPHRSARVASLSLGMRQRLGLAAAMLTDPPALLLDEPFNALDPTEAAAVYSWVANLTDQGRTIVVSTHHLDRIEPYVTHALFLNEGRLIASGTPADIAASRGISSPLHVVTDRPMELAAALALEGARTVARTDRLLSVDRVGQAEVELVAARCGANLAGTWRSQPSLSELYAAII